MKKVFFSCMLLSVVFLLWACGASVKMIDSWMDDSKAGYKINNVLVIGISRKDITRNLWENTFVELLGKENIKAQAGHIAIDGCIANAHLALVAGGQQHMTKFVAHRHQGHTADSGLDILFGNVDLFIGKTAFEHRVKTFDRRNN